MSAIKREEFVLKRFVKYCKIYINSDNKDLIKVCDICHIYDNSKSSPFCIFKKRKECIYFDECDDWYFEDIRDLTGISDMEKKNLN